MSAYDNPRRLTLTFDFPRPGDALLRSILRPVFQRLADNPDQLDISLEGFGPHVFNRGEEHEVRIRVAHAFLDLSVLEPRDRAQLRVRYDQGDDVLTAEDVRYAGELFRGLGLLPLNTFVKLRAREDGVLTVQAIPEEEWRVPRQDVADVVDWIFQRFGAPVDAGELPQHIVQAVRRLESALATPELVSEDGATWRDQAPGDANNPELHRLAGDGTVTLPPDAAAALAEVLAPAPAEGIPHVQA